MFDFKSRDFIKGYEVVGNKVNVFYGTGDSKPVPISEKYKIKNKIDKQISDLQEIKENAKLELKRRKIHSYLNIGIILGSLITLGSVAPGLLPMISLSSVAAGNGALYMHNKKKMKELNETINNKTISNMIFNLQKSQKDSIENSNNYAKSHTNKLKATKENNQINNNNEMIQEETLKKTA